VAFHADPWKHALTQQVARRAGADFPDDQVIRAPGSAVGPVTSTEGFRDVKSKPVHSRRALIRAFRVCLLNPKPQTLTLSPRRTTLQVKIWREAFITGRSLCQVPKQQKSLAASIISSSRDLFSSSVLGAGGLSPARPRESAPVQRRLVNPSDGFAPMTIRGGTILSVEQHGEFEHSSPTSALENSPLWGRRVARDDSTRRINRLRVASGGVPLVNLDCKLEDVAE